MKGLGKGVKEEMKKILREVVVVVGEKGFVSVEVEYVEGRKIEWKGKKYRFVWGKRVEGKGGRVIEKVKCVVGEIEECIGEEKGREDERVEVSG